MVTMEFEAKSFKKMEDPINRGGEKVKYVCYAKAITIPLELNDWMKTNPREQKMTTNVAKNIIESLKENDNFHELNRGIVLSVNKVSNCIPNNLPFANKAPDCFILVIR